MRITKAMLEAQNKSLTSRLVDAHTENYHLKEVIAVYKSRSYPIEEITRSHSMSLEAIAHVISDLNSIIKQREQS